MGWNESNVGKIVKTFLCDEKRWTRNRGKEVKKFPCVGGQGCAEKGRRTEKERNGGRERSCGLSESRYNATEDMQERINGTSTEFSLEREHSEQCRTCSPASLCPMDLLHLYFNLLSVFLLLRCFVSATNTQDRFYWNF